MRTPLQVCIHDATFMFASVDWEFALESDSSLIRARGPEDEASNRNCEAAGTG